MSNNHVSSHDTSIESLFGILDGEQSQEELIYASTGINFAASNSEIAREREREYRDIEKHYVRKDGWLKTAKQLADMKAKSKDRGVGLRYLTLPAYYRLDVSLLLRSNLIEVTRQTSTGNPEEVYVAAFEADPSKFGRMVGQTPGFKLFGASTIESALIDKNNEYYRQLRTLFPFDIVNLDLTTSLTPRHEGPYSRTMKALDAVFELQAGCAHIWSMFLTFRNEPADWEVDALDQLLGNLQKNLDDFPPVQDAFIAKYQVNTVRALRTSDERQCISQAVSKWIVDRANSYKFKMHSFRGYRYARYNSGLDPYHIYKQIFVFEPADISNSHIPTRTLPIQSWTLSNLAACIQSGKCIDVEDRLFHLSNGSWSSVFSELSAEVDNLCSLIQ